MEELKARFLVLIERRKVLAAIVAREHRDWTEDELAELAKLNSALEAIRFTLNELVVSEANVQGSGAATVPSDDDYRLQAAAFRDVQLSNLKFAVEQVGQSGRWLLATVGATHFGGLWLLTQLAGKIQMDDLRPAMWYLVAGLFLILVSGLVTYWNWSTGTRVYSNLLGPGYLVDRKMWPQVPAKDARIIGFTQFAAIVLGILSILCILPAAYLVATAHLVAPVA